MKRKIQFAIVGGGWHAEFFLRVAGMLPERFEVTGIVVRNPEKRQAFEQKWQAKVFADVNTMLDAVSAEFVLTAVSWASNPSVIQNLAQRNVPVLSETPPAPDLESLLGMYKLVEQGAKIQVAEQYWLVPNHAALQAILASGIIGKPTQAQISTAHGYHGMSLIRRFLRIGFDLPRITAIRFKSPLVGWSDAAGKTDTEKIENTAQDIVWLDFGERFAALDFTDAQYYSPIRNERILVRGEKGEIINDRVFLLKDGRTPVSMKIQHCLEGLQDKVGAYRFRGITFGDNWVYTNEFPEASLNVHEIAVASCLVKMDEYLQTGKDCYSFADAAQDHYLNLLYQQAIAQNITITAERQPWTVSSPNHE